MSQAENGVTQSHEYDSMGNRTFTHYSDGTFEAFCYNSRNQVIRSRDRGGDVVRMTYDIDGRLLTREVGLTDSAANASPDPYIQSTYNRCATDDVATADYATWTWTYHATGTNGAGRVASITGPLGEVKSFVYDASHRLIETSHPTDSTNQPVKELRTYDAYGRLKTKTSPVGSTAEHFYDTQHRRISTLFDDGTSHRWIYSTSGANYGLLIKEIDRLGVVTTYSYDNADRLIETVHAAAQMDGSTEVPTPSLASATTYAYVDGTDDLREIVHDGATTRYVYDYRGRRVRTIRYPNDGTRLESKLTYVNNQLFSTEDPYGRKTYYAYDATNGRLIRTVVGTVPEFEILASDPNTAGYNPFTAVLNLVRDDSANADYFISDMVFDAEGNVVESYDARLVKTEHEYDRRDRQVVLLTAVGTAIEAKTETDYDLASNVVEVRSPRYFDPNDTLGYQKAKETWTYNGRGLVATHTEAPGATETATESFTYDLNGRRISHTDFAGKVWETHYEDCCGQVVASENPLGDGTITRKDATGRAVHQVSVEDYAAHTSSLDDPVDAKTLREITTKYDGRGRPVARTTWLVARGTVDVTDPPIAGLGGVSASDGLTEQYLYDDNLVDDSGLDNSSGATPLIGSGGISLAAALTKLADTEANGGAGVSFDSDAPGSARVSINPEGEVRFAISDAAGRSVMSGMLDPSDSSLITWNCSKHDDTTTISGYGTVLVSKSINALGHVNQSLTDAVGRTLQSIDALGKITSYEYDAAGNQLKVRDPNNVGQDCTYDALGRDTSCTDTSSSVTSSSYDLAGNKIASTDAKSETTTYTFDARGRQVKQTDRLGGETEYAYTATGQLLSLTDAEDQVTNYTYDDAGTKLTETYPDHTPSTSPGNAGYGIVTFTVDPAGRVLRKQDQLGDTVTYNYDLAGRLTSRDYRTAANSPSGTIADSDTFTYDDAGRMLTATSGRYSNTVTYTYDEGGRKASEATTIASVTYTTSTEYDAAGQVSTLVYPDGTEVDRTYSDRGQLATLAVDSTTIDTRTYDDGGRMTGSSYNNGVSETRAYNNDNTLASISFAGAAIGNLTYGWDANKNKTSEGISGTMSGYGFAVGTSGYDDEDRLVNWERSDSNLDQSWNLSLVGDWNSITENSSTENRTHGPTHEMLTAAGASVTHDAKGNITSIPAVLRPTSDPLAMTWDFDNRLVSADVDNDSTADVFYKWDALGRRVLRDDGTTATVFVQSGQQTIADYTSGAAATSPTYTYVYASYIDEPVMRGGTGGLRYYHRNQQYSVIALTNGGGSITERYAYSAYGTPTIADGSGTVLTSSADNNRYTYTGREWDSSLSLYHYRARMYDSVAGRFCSRDPIAFVGGPHLYAYCYGMPLKLVDVTGELAAVPTVLPGVLTPAGTSPHGIVFGCGITVGVLIGDLLIGDDFESISSNRPPLPIHPHDPRHPDYKPQPDPKPVPRPPAPPTDRNCDEDDDECPPGQIWCCDVMDGTWATPDGGPGVGGTVLWNCGCRDEDDCEDDGMTYPADYGTPNGTRY